MEAGKNVMQLFRNRGWTAIIADTMIDTVLFMVSIGVGLLIGLLSIVVAAVVGQGDGATMAISFLIGCMIGYAITATLFSIVSSATNTVIVCYAEAPAEFQANHPELFNKMLDSWRQAWPSEFNY
jgi:xanthosine utilization system XapX-like protein